MSGLKISEVIAKLNTILATHGDLHVIVQNDHCSDATFVAASNVDYTYNIRQTSTITYDDVEIEDSTGIAALIN